MSETTKPDAVAPIPDDLRPNDLGYVLQLIKAHATRADRYEQAAKDAEARATKAEAALHAIAVLPEETTSVRAIKEFAHRKLQEQP